MLYRLCPGKDFADTNIYLMIANIVATMDIAKVRDADGQEITPPAEFEAGSSRYARVPPLCQT